jgi:hypothetical protein
MFNNYKKISLVLFILVIFLILTDSSFEKYSRKSLSNLFNITIEEGENISSNAPETFFGFLEDSRNYSVNFLDKQANNFEVLKNSEKSFLSWFFLLISLFFSLLGFLFGYIIIFYPLLILIIYFIWTSRIFRRNDF